MEMGNEGHISWAHRKILVFLLWVVVINCLNSALIASVSGTVNLRRQVLQDYFLCEARGRQAECDASEVANVEQTSNNLLTASLIVSALYPALLLPFTVNVKELKKSCKHIYSFLRTSCVSKK